MDIIIINFVIFILGLSIGSFLNVCIYRIPIGKSIVKPPSHCTNCGTILKPYELIPVFSYLFLKGKCGNCKTKISARYPLIEVLTAAVFILLFNRYGPTVGFFASAFLMSILIAVFFIDMDCRIIPNELVVTGLVGGAFVFVYNVFEPLPVYGDSNWWNPLLGALIGAGFLFIIAFIGSVVYKSDEAMGGGDIKIFAPIGIFLGWKMTIVALFISIFLGGMISLFVIIFRLKNKKDAIPFGPFIVTGTFITLMWGWEILNWYVGRL